MSIGNGKASTVALVTALILAFGSTGCVGSEAERKLISKILDRYNPMVRPASHYREVINVTFSLTLQQIVDLDEKNQLLTTSMYMGWAWKDSYLTWDPIDYEGITDVRLPAKKLWKPDILVYNSAVDTFDQMLQTNVIIYSTGRVEWLPPGLFKTTCDVDIRYFPFDEQKCQIKFGAWTYHGGLVDLVLVNEDAILDDYTESGEWDLLSMKGKRTAVVYDCCDHPFVDVTYTVHMRRRTLFYGFNLILPCVLVCSLTILVFLLPADSGERITLGITVLLALVVFLQLVADNLPPTDVIPLLGITLVLAIVVFMVPVTEAVPQSPVESLVCKYFACSIVMVTSSVICTVISLNFHHTTAANANEMPFLIRLIFLEFLPKHLHMKRPGENSFRRKFIDGESDPDLLHNEQHQPLVKVDGGQPDPTSNGQTGPIAKTEDRISHRSTLLTDANEEMTKILEELTFITDRLHSEDEDEKCALEWRFAATVLDKFCVWFFIIYFVVSTIFTICLAPGMLLPYLD